ncbi:unnamed protein product, partial [Ectocarpus sp. 13 AM-2016]
MSQSRVNLATAKRELAERRDEANLCMVELKHAQEVLAAGGTGPKVLSVTVQEVFGPITVDRVAVRPDASPAQEKVVAQGIPCTFPLDATVESFDLVLMAENDNGAGATKSAAVDQASASKEDSSQLAEAAAVAVAGDGHETDEVVISAEDAAEAVEAEAAAAATATVPDAAEAGEAGVNEVAAAAAATTAAAAGAVSEQGNDAEEEFHDASGAAAPVADAAEAPVAEETEAVGAEAGQGETAESEPAGEVGEAKEATDEASPVASGTTGDESNANVVDAAADPASAAAAAAAAAAEEEVAAAAVETPAAEGDVAAAAEVDVTPVEDGDGDSAAAGLSLDTAAAEAEAAAAAAEAAVAAAGPVAGDDPETAPAATVAEAAGEVAGEADTGAARASLNGGVGGASPAAAEALGCSTGTTEVVVPSSELDFKLSQGQWRYLEADSTPVHGDGAVEVTKGIRFSTSLKAVDSREDDDRIVELSEKLSDAERRVRAAGAMVSNPTPS